MAETKICTICKNAKPLTIFSNNSLARDGKDTRCTPCNTQRIRERNKPEAIAKRKALAEFKTAHPNLKKCADCKEFKDISHFYPKKNTQTTISYCKPCSNKRSRLSDMKSKDKLSAYNKARYRRDRDKRLADARRYRQENADIIRERNKRWRANNRAKDNFYSSKKRALKRSGVWEYYDRFEVFSRDNGICCICLVAIDITLKSPHKLSFTIQHLWPISLGGPDILDNVAPAHFSCNSKVGNRKIMTRAN